MSAELTPLSELADRIGKLQKLMVSGEVGGALIVQRADLFYFTGTAQNAHLFIPARGEPKLLVKKNLYRARTESKLPRITEFQDWSQLAGIIKSEIPPSARIGLELDVVPAAQYIRYQKMLAPTEISDISPLVRRVRAVKTPYEIKQLHVSAALGEAVFTFAREILSAGITEVEFAAKLEAFARSKGHQGAVRMRGFNQELFYGHIMAGESATTLSFFDGPTGGPGLNPSYPQGAGSKRIGRNEPVLVDYVTVYNGYMVDQTRIFCLGSLPAPMLKAYQTALQIMEALIRAGKAGSNGRDLYLRAEEIAQRAGIESHFMGYEETVSFIGHGVGLELDELPVIARGLDFPLEEGMVFALEPKFIFPGEGVVGIEDTYVVRSEGLEQITCFDNQIQQL